MPDPHSFLRLRPLVLAAALALAGCVAGPRAVVTPSTPSISPDESGHYETLPGRGPDVVATLRAAPPPAEPELVDGRDRRTDIRQLAAASYLEIGTSRFAPDDADARTRAQRQGQRVGADRVVVYPPSALDTGDTFVAYYVRVQLPFGATFRDLHADERKVAHADGGGVVIGRVIGNSPASRANLLTGDIVLRIDGAPIAGRGAFQQALKAHAGRPVTLTIVRNGERIDRMVRLSVVPDAGEPEAR